MNTSLRAAFLLLPVASACSGPAEMTCPDPVGMIVRDDCEVYRARYETLKVELGASIGPVGAKVELGQQKLREMSRLIQVLKHRTFTLCRDFNACRVPPVEYRRRREETDRVFAAVAAIQEQLKQATLDARNRARLVEALVRALGGGKTRRIRASGRRQIYRGYLPWLGAKHLPPLPSAKAGFPRLLWVDGEVGPSRHKVDRHTYKTKGYRPKVRVALQGKVESDDLIVARWDKERRTESLVHKYQRNGLVVQTLKAPEDIGFEGASFAVEVLYRRGVDGEEASLGRRTFPVVSSQERYHGSMLTHYAVDSDSDASQGLLVFRPYPGVLPATHDRPSVVVVLKLRKNHRPTARCWADGKPVGGALLPGRYGGQHATFQDRPSNERISPRRGRSVSQRYVTWRRYDFPLPLVVVRGGPAPDKLERWPRPGKWRCVVSLDGEPARELTFEVLRDGRLRPHPAQQRHSRAEWLVATKVLANPVEMPLGEFHRYRPDGPDQDQHPVRLSSFQVRVGPRIRGPLSIGRVRAVMAKARAALAACAEREQVNGAFRFSAHVFPGGQAGLNMVSKTDHWISGCLSAALKSVRFPKAKGYTYFDCQVRAAGRFPVAGGGALRIWNVRGGHSASLLLEAFRNVLPALRRCAGRKPGRHRAKMAVGKDGKVELSQWGRSAHPAMTHCLGRTLTSVQLGRVKQFTTFTIELRLGR